MDTKRCSKCGEEKPVGMFGKRNNSKDGLNEWCKACACESSRKYRKKNLEKVRAANREYRRKIRKENPEKHRAVRREWQEANKDRLAQLRKEKRKNNRFETLLEDSIHRAKQHGYEPCKATIDELKAAFTGHCQICRVPEIECNQRLHMDHDHKTGYFRGFLCNNCNRALGHFKESEEILINALHYLMTVRSQV